MRFIFILVFLALISAERDWIGEIQTVPHRVFPNKDFNPQCQYGNSFNYNVEGSTNWIVYVVERLFFGLQHKFKRAVYSTVRNVKIADQNFRRKYDEYTKLIFPDHGQTIAVPSSSIAVDIRAKSKFHVTLLRARLPNYSIGFYTTEAGSNRLTSGRRDYDYSGNNAWALGPMLFPLAPTEDPTDNTVSVELDMSAKVGFYILKGPWPSCADDWPGRTIQSIQFEAMENFGVHPTPRAAWLYVEKLNSVIIGFKAKDGSNSGYDFVIAVQMDGDVLKMNYVPVFEDVYPTYETPVYLNDQVIITRDCALYSAVMSSGGKYKRLSVPDGWSLASYDSRSKDLVNDLSRALDRVDAKCFYFERSMPVVIGGKCIYPLPSVHVDGKKYYEIQSGALVITKTHPQCTSNSRKYCEPKKYEVMKLDKGLHPDSLHIDVGYVSDEPVTFESQLKLPSIESAEIQMVIISNQCNMYRSINGISNECVRKYQSLFKSYSNLSYMYVTCGSIGCRAREFQTDITDTLISGKIFGMAYSNNRALFIRNVRNLLRSDVIKWKPGAFRVIVLTSDDQLAGSLSLEEDSARIGAYVVSVSNSANKDFFGTVGGIHMRTRSGNGCWQFEALFPNNAKRVDRVLDRAYANDVVSVTTIGSVASPVVTPNTGNKLMYTTSVHIKPQSESKKIFGISRLHVSGWSPQEVSIYVNTAPYILDQDRSSNMERQVTKENRHNLLVRFNIKDIDENLIKVIISQLPTYGMLYWGKVGKEVSVDESRTLNVGDVFYEKDLIYGPIYVPNYLYHGQDSFKYTVSDGCLDVGPVDFKIDISYCRAILAKDYILTAKMDYKSETKVLNFEHVHDIDEEAGVEARIEIEVEILSIPPLTLGMFVNQDGEQIKSVPYSFLIRNNTEIKFVVSKNVHREQDYTLKYVARRADNSYTNYCRKQTTSEGNIQLIIKKGKYIPEIRSYYPNNTVVANVPGTTFIDVICGNWYYDEVMSLGVLNIDEMPIKIPDECKNFSPTQGEYVCKVEWELNESNLYKYRDPVINFILTQSDGANSTMDIRLSTTSRFVSIRNPHRVTVMSGGYVNGLLDNIDIDSAQNYRIYIASMPKYGDLSYKDKKLKCASGAICPESGITYGGTRELFYSAYNHVVLEGLWKISDGRRVVSDSFHFYMYNGSAYTDIATQAVDIVRIDLPPESKNAEIEVSRGKSVDFSLEFTGMNFRNCSVCFPISEKDRIVYVEKSKLQEYAEGICTAPAESKVNLTYVHTSVCPKPSCSFKFWIKDRDLSSYRYSVTVKVVNSAPEAKDLEFTVERERALRIVVNDSFFTDDVESQPWKVKFISTNVEFGQMNISENFAELALNQWLPSGAYIDYISSSDDISPPKITVKFVIRDEEDLDSEPGTIAISVVSHRLQPTTTLTSVYFTQGSVTEIQWMSREYVHTEIPQSSLHVILKSLPKYGVFTVNGEEVKSLDQKFYENDAVMYESDPWEWGDERDAIDYILKDNLTDKDFNKVSTLKISLLKVHRIPVIQIEEMDTEKIQCVSSRCTLNLYSHENYKFRFNVSSPSVTPRNLSTEIKVIPYNKNFWEIKSQEQVIMSSHNNSRASIYSVPPLNVVDKKCPDDRALYGLRGNISDECMVKYQVQINTLNTSRGFPLISVLLSAISVGDFRDNKVRYSHTVWIDVIMSVLNTPPVLQTLAEVYLLEDNKVSFQFNISDALSERCNETLVISADGGTGFWTFDQDVSSCTQNSTTVVCQDTIENYMTFLPALRFRPESKAISGVQFTLFDNGCGGVSFDSTPVQNLSATSYTKISGTFKKTESRTRIIIAAVGSIAGFASVAGIVTYITKKFKHAPDDDYFVDSSSLTSASQNPLFRSAHIESNNPIYQSNSSFHD